MADENFISIRHRYEGLESFAHRLAKQLFAKWLRDRAALAGFDEYAALGQICWRVNRPAPSWGVWIEYPFGPNREGSGQNGAVWDEEFSYDSEDDFWRSPYDDRPPTFDELCGHGIVAKYIVDIAIQHKGIISDVIEIVHKNPLNNNKRKFLISCAFCRVWEIPAYWVLGQVNVPKDIPSKFQVY